MELGHVNLGRSGKSREVAKDVEIEHWRVESGGFFL